VRGQQTLDPDPPELPRLSLLRNCIEEGFMRHYRSAGAASAHGGEKNENVV
jgi:hypothetical protein